MTRTIQCSDVLGSAFAEFCRRWNGCKRIKNLQMRKHRFDSTQRPTGRLVLYLNAFISTAVFAATHRKGQRDGHRAEGFLEYITEQRLLLISMCADASDEVTVLLRFLDSGTYDLSTLVAEIQQFVGRVARAFQEIRLLRAYGADVASTSGVYDQERPTISGWPSKDD